MAKRTADQLSGTPLSLVYIADNTVDALKAERVLSEQGIDYTLSLEPFASASVLLVGERTGLFVYVPAAQHRLCVDLLDRNGLKDTVDMDEATTKEPSDGT
jgi:hypothetical protein